MDLRECKASKRRRHDLWEALKADPFFRHLKSQLEHIKRFVTCEVGRFPKSQKTLGNRAVHPAHLAASIHALHDDIADLAVHAPKAG